jgi:hypothetical protein
MGRMCAVEIGCGMAIALGSRSNGHVDLADRRLESLTAWSAADPTARPSSADHCSPSTSQLFSSTTTAGKSRLFSL